jgi:hypothetical protein
MRVDNGFRECISVIDLNDYRIVVMIEVTLCCAKLSVPTSPNFLCFGVLDVILLNSLTFCTGSFF